MPTKHIFVVHGRSTKPVQEEKERLVKKALIAGLARIDPSAAQSVSQGEVNFTLIYYGDIINEVMIKAEPRRKEKMVQHGEAWYEPMGSYDQDLTVLLERPTESHSARDYRVLLENVKDRQYVDDLVRIISPVARAFGLSEKAIKKMFPDLAAYLTSRVIGSGIRDRLQRPLKETFLGGDDVCLVSHSMGCIVAYDVLWKFSRMSEYKEVRDIKVPLWITVGNPLGEPWVQDNLYDSDEPEDGRYPSNIRRWVNISAHDDIVAHDRDIKDDFREMTERGLIDRDKIEDPPRIYNFWVGSDGSNPHKLYGYLNHPAFASTLAEWLNS